MNQDKRTTIHRRNRTLQILAILLIVLGGCSKEESTSTISITHGQDLVHAKVAGIVLNNINGQGIAGVSITANGVVTTSDQNGLFILDGWIAKDRPVIRFSKPGFLNRQHAMKLNPAAVNYVRIAMAPEPFVQYRSAVTGGTINAGSGISIQFPPAAFVLEGGNTPYTGTVSISAQPFSVNDPFFSMEIPGGDLSGKDLSGNAVSLSTFGMVDVVLKGSSGESLQLSSGITATIIFPIASSQLAIAPSTISLWYLDESTALWKEDGQAIKTGSNYIGEVSHFTTWNVDYGGPTATASGRVIDCNGLPLPNVMVNISGVSVLTDQNGEYSHWVPSGWFLSFQVPVQGVITLPSQSESVGPLSAGQNYIVPDLIVPCASYIQGHLTDCSGLNTTGTVCVLQNGTLRNFIVAQNEPFNMLAPSNSVVTLAAFSSNGFNAQTVLPLSVGASIDLGPIQLCNTVGVNTNFSFTLNGAGFSNAVVNVVCLQNEMYYYAGGDLTECKSQVISNVVTDSMGVYFPGNQVTTVDYSLSGPGDFYIVLGQNRYQPSLAVGDHFILNVTHYGAVGDSIKGTFAGKLVSVSDTTAIQITNGQFSMPRTHDR